MPAVFGPPEVVIASGKGGVGKSTISAAIAIEVARAGHKVVAADADAEAPNLHIVLGVREWESEEPFHEGRIAYIDRGRCTECGICAQVCPFRAVEVVNGHHVINEMICEGCLTCALACPEKAIRYRVNVVAGKLRVGVTKYGFRLVSGEIVPGRPNSGKLVTEVKNRAKALLGGEGVLIIDAAAGIGCQVVSSLTGSHIAILVAEPTPASLHDLARVRALTKHFGMAAAVVINKADLSTEWAARIREYANKENMPVLGEIPYDDAVPKAVAKGAPVTEAYPGSPAAKAIREVAETVAKEILPNWLEWYEKYRVKEPHPYTPIIIRPATK